MDLAADNTILPSPGRLHLGPQRAWVCFAALSAMAIATYLVLPHAGVGQAVLQNPMNAPSLAATVRAALRAHGSTRVVWVALACAMASNTLAYIPYDAVPLITGHKLSYPSAIDALFLVSYPFYVVALLALARHRRRADRRDDFLDVALLTLGGGTLMWVVVIGPVVQAPAESVLAHIVSVAYPMMDLAVFAVFTRLMVSGLHRSAASRLLLAGFVALLAGDMTWAFESLTGTYMLGQSSDGLWMGFTALVGVAALHPSARAFPRAAPAPGLAVSKYRLAFLFMWALVGPLLITVDHGDDPLVGTLTVVAFLLVMTRLTGLNWRLESVSRELEKRATTDALTGLSNRSALAVAVDAALANRPHGVSLLLVDLDDFKQVNDLAGHSAGDAILVEAAHRMRLVMRGSDVIARLGGDEFAIVVSGSAEEGQWLGERLISAVREPFVFGGRSFNLGASVGVVAAGPGAQAERLIHDADIAMYAAKRQGRNRVVVFEDSMYADIVERSDFLLALHGAVDRGEMRLEYQPIVRLGDAAVVGLEALVRWWHPVFGEVPPARFIPLAEESGAIVPLGRWVIETALRDVALLDRFGETPLTINVNVSAEQLLDRGFASDVALALRNAGVHGRRLVIELTEGALVKHGGEAARQLDELGSLGVRISIDDFGTGYSSLAYLQRLPVEEVKIDRSFIEGLEHGDTYGSVVRAILRMCEELGLRCIAEGVERPEQVAILRGAGGYLAQGFHFGRPMPIYRVARMLPAPATQPRMGPPA